jgi:triosephosphate isomerase
MAEKHLSFFGTDSRHILTRRTLLGGAAGLSAAVLLPSHGRANLVMPEVLPLATEDYADARQREILTVAEQILGRRVPCLYGGSVNPGNCAELIACPHIDGLFIGRSAWEPEGYLDILARCAATI